MSKIFLDNNIILDFLVAERGELNRQAVKLFKGFKKEDIVCYSYGSVSDIAYVAKKAYGVDDKIIVDFFQALSQSSNFKCISLSNNGLLRACEYAKEEINKNNNVDFEDILQYFCALENGCEAIYTNDRNFPQLDIAVKRTNPNLTD